MRVNTTKSLRLAARVKQRYGSWQAVKDAARLENGIYIIERAPKEESQSSQPVKGASAAA